MTMSVLDLQAIDATETHAPELASTASCNCF